jgi:hypothetical protein
VATCCSSLAVARAEGMAAATLRYNANASPPRRLVGRAVRAAVASIAIVAFLCKDFKLFNHASSSFVDAEGVRRFAPPAPDGYIKSAWVQSLKYVYGDEDEAFVRRMSREEAEARACEYCRAFGDVVERIGASKSNAHGLELASGGGQFVRDARARGINLVGVDPRLGSMKGFAAELLARGEATVAELTKLPYKTGHFDFLVAFEPFGKIHVTQTASNVDPVVNEATRVAKIGATWIFAAHATLNGRVASSIAGDERAVYKTRRWWLDTFCAHGWAPDDDVYMKLVATASVDEKTLSPATSSDFVPHTPTPRSWFVLRRVRKIQACSCAVPSGRDEKNFCGTVGRPNAQSEVKAFWKSLNRKSIVVS